MSQVINSFVEGLFQYFFLEISSKRIKVGVAFIFCHLVDVTALWHTSKVFESSLNSLKLFFTKPANSDRLIRSFILKEKQFLALAGCFLACAGSVENLR